MKKIIFVTTMAFSSISSAYDYNDAFGTFEGISTNYVTEETIDPISTYNEENGYWGSVPAEYIEYDYNDTYGTSEGISDNYVSVETNSYDSVQDFVHTSELTIAEENGYFGDWDLAVSTWNEENGYW